MSVVGDGSRDSEDEALAWAGDEGPVAGATPDVRVVELRADTKQSVPAPLIVTYGILAGAYLIYTAGWIVAVTRSTTRFSDLLPEIMFQLGEFLAIASPAVWFAAILLVTRDSRTIVRLLLVLAGLVTTIPWPFVLGV